MNIFEKNGYPTDSNPYLFNGDFVDRGSFGVEVLSVLMSYFLVGDNVLNLNRGNHESEGLNRLYGFEAEVKHK